MEKAERRRIWLLVLVFVCGIAVGLTLSGWKWMLIDSYQRFTKSPPVHQSIAAVYDPYSVPCR